MNAGGDVRDRHLEDRTARLRAVAERYGYDEVPASQVYVTFEAISDRGAAGFSTIKPGLYGKVVDADIIHVMKMQAVKGASYTVRWGVSLSYVPRVQGERVRWHRTLKSAALDLFEEPLEYLNLQDDADAEPDTCFAMNGHGPQYLRETMTRMWSTVDAPVRAWFDGTKDLAGVLLRADEQRARTWRGPRHHPDPRLVRAFTLRRLGRDADARAALDEYVATDAVPASEIRVLNEALVGSFRRDD